MKQWLTKALLVLAGIIIALALCEAGLRLLGIEYPDFFDYDPLVGSKLRPGIKGYFLKEGGGYVSINSDGLRDREHPLNPPPNTLRIAVLGDSFAEAMQVNREEAFWAIMEKDLQGCGNLRGRRIEVINFGQSGFGTTQELLALRHRVWKYSPEIVLLAFFTGNDVADNSQALMQWNYVPYFSFQDGELVLNDKHTQERWEKEQREKSWGGEFKRWREDNFRVFQVWREAHKLARTWWSQIQTRGQSDAAHQRPKAGLSNAVFRKPTEAVWQEAWKITEAVLLMMRDEIAQKGARFFVVVLTNSIQVHPDPENRKNFAKMFGVQDLFYPDRRLEKFCHREGIPILLLAPAFQEYATKHQVFLHGFQDNLGGGHWNQNGNRLAGKMIAEWLCGQLN
jgi:hypothetical protein